MSDFIPKATKGKVGGLSRAAQKLEAARAKAAQNKNDEKQQTPTSNPSLKAKDSFANTKKTGFNRKAV